MKNYILYFLLLILVVSLSCTTSSKAVTTEPTINKKVPQITNLLRNGKKYYIPTKFGNSYSLNPAVFDLQEDVIPHLDNPTMIQSWVSVSITYTREEGDYWQTSSETLARGKGDCDDMAILLVNLLRLKGYEAYLALGYLGDKDLNHINHAWAVLVKNNQAYYLDPTQFPYVMSNLENYHHSVAKKHKIMVIYP